MLSISEVAPVRAPPSPMATAGAAARLGPLVERLAESDEERLNDIDESVGSSILPV